MNIPADIATAPGECAEFLRTHDWSKTALGPISQWPASLRVTTATMLRSNQPTVLLWGPDALCLYNDAYMPSFGAHRHPSAFGLPAHQAWPENWHMVQHHFAAVMKGVPSPQFDNRMVPVWRRGRLEEVYWSFSYAPIPQHDGTIGGAMVVCQETTATVVSQRRMRLALAVDDALFRCDDSEALYSTFARVIQSRDIRAAVVFRSNGDVRPLAFAGPNGCDALLEQLARRLSTGDVPVGRLRLPEHAVPLSDWPHPASDLYVTPIGAGGALGYLAVLLHPGLSFDTRYRRHIEQLVNLVLHHQARIDRDAVRAAVEHERDRLLDQAPIAFAVLSGPDHVFALANNRYMEMVSSEDSVIGRAFAEVFPRLADHPMRLAMDTVYREGTSFTDPEAYFDPTTTSYGVEKYFSIAMQPMRGDHQQITGLMLVVVDVTEEVSARISLEKNEKDRIQLIEKLEAASRAKDEFLAMLGHELRNPLSPILTAVELLKLRGAKGIDVELGIIERQLQQMVGLVDDLLDIARVTRGAVQLYRTRLMVSELCSRAIEQASPLIDGRRHTLSVDVPDDLWVEGDARRLAQILGNLLNNAAKYTPSEGEVALTAREVDDSVVLTVRDSGIGVEQEQIAQMFTPFVRERRDASAGGLGLGLSIVRSLVEAHSGTVELTSDGPGAGTTVTVTLPQSSPLPRPDPPSLISSYPPGSSSLRILIVDDNKDAADLLAAALRLQGHTLEVRYSPESALASAESFIPHVALFDLGMPVIDGYELHRRMQRVSSWAKVHFIAVTGYGQQADRQRSLAAGFVAHLVKPVDLEELERQLSRLRDAHQV